MAIALVSSVVAKSTSGNGFTTSSIDTSGASLLVAYISSYASAAAPSITDSNGNTWNYLTTYTQASSVRGRIAYAINPTVGAGHTFTVSGTTNYPSLGVAAFSGVDTSSPYEVENGAVTVATAASLQTGSITPATNNALVISGASIGSASVTVSVDSGLTEIGELALVGGQAFGVCLAYLIQGTAAAINPTWTNSVSGYLATAIASFEAAAGGGTVIPVFMNQYRQRCA
jgi:hypothetical protein